MQRLLIVEDNSSFLESLKASVEECFEVDLCSSVPSALGLLQTNHYDILLCDYILGSSNGLDIVEHAKRLIFPPKILMMTAFAEKEMVIKALNLGVSHFLTKPFSVKELRSVLNIKKSVQAEPIAKTTFYPESNTVSWRGDRIKLTPSEYLILSYLTSKSHWVSREQLEGLLWSDSPHVSRNILDTHIYNLKKKIPSLGGQLQALRGKGFLLKTLD